MPEYIEFTEIYERYCQCRIGTEIERFYKLSYFEVSANIEAYQKDLEYQNMPLELQTKWLVSCNGFTKVNASEVNFFNRDKKENNIKISDKELEIAKQASEIFRSKRGHLIN